MGKKRINMLFFISLFAIAAGCYLSDSERLIKVSEHKINVPEPSGLTITSDGKTLYTVSDEKNQVYRLSLNGKVKEKFKVKGSDFEGITMLDDTTLAVVLEKKREIVLLNSYGDEIKRVKLDIKGDSKYGLEGISFNKKNNHFFLVNGEQPRRLFELNDNYEVINSNKITFADDFSGLYYDSENDWLWILSDQNSMLYKCDTRGKLLKKYILNIAKPEGVAIDFQNNLIYIVSDSKEKLYLFRFDR